MRYIILFFLFWQGTLHAQEFFRGGAVILSTTDEEHVLTVRGADSVAVFGLPGVSGVNDPPARVFQRRPDGGWDSLVIHRSIPRGVNQGLMAWHNVEYDSGAARYVGTVHLARTIDSVRTVSVGRAGDALPPQRIIDVVPHPYAPSVAIVRMATDRSGFEDAFVTADAGATWSLMNIPKASTDKIRSYRFWFDARNPKRIYMIVQRRSDADTAVVPLLYDGWYTDDMGASFRDTLSDRYGRLRDLIDPAFHSGVGIWSEVGGLTYRARAASTQRMWYLTSDSLFIDPGDAPRRVELPWLMNARRSLAPDFDSTTDVFVYNDNRVLGFHPARPDLIVGTFVHRFEEDTGTTSVRLLAMSTDFGQSWSMLARIARYPGWSQMNFMEFVSVDIDPHGPHIYASYLHMVRDSARFDFRGSTHTVEWRNVPMAVEDDRVAQTGSSLLRTSPNPVSGSATLRVNVESPLEMSSAQDVAIYDASGSLAATCGAHIVSDKAFDIKLPGLAPGVYVLVVRMATTTLPVRFVVLD